MNTLSLFKMENDRGYAWVILGASVILMCSGPSTLTSFGFLFRDISYTPKIKSWILNVFYISWLLSAFLVAFSVKQRPRQLATSGAALASLGFLATASLYQNVSWIYLTFSVFVGFGLGLSFHTAYLLAMSNFDKHKGLANGICQIFIAIGQITTPLLLTIPAHAKDRFLIKTLTTVLCFLTTLFFVVPKINSYRPPPALVGDRNRRPSTVTRRNSIGDPLQSGFVVLPSTNPVPINNNNPIPNRQRRRSQYLLQVSTSLLPNIPEESESTHSTSEQLTSSDTEVHNIQSNSLGSQNVAVTTPGIDAWGELEPLNPLSGQIASSKESNEPTNQHFPLRRLSEGCLPTYVSGRNGLKPTASQNAPKAPILSKSRRPSVPTPDRMRYYSESESQSDPSKKLVPTKNGKSNKQITAGHGKNGDLYQPQRRNSDQQNYSRKSSLFVQATNSSNRRGESITDLSSLITDFKFLNMAVFTAVCTLAVINYPVVLYMYIVKEMCGSSCDYQAEYALGIIYVADLIFRLLFSYVTDIVSISNRRGFQIGSACIGVIIAVTTTVQNDDKMYILCVLFGICQGLILTSEHLMYIESFGIQRFPFAYGLVHLAKVLLFFTLFVLTINPIAAYQYSIHPFDRTSTSKNISTLETIDFADSLTPDGTSLKRTLLGLAVPPILCALAWFTEDLYNIASRRCNSPNTEKAEARMP